MLAGTNGAGKSSIIGEMIRCSGADYFDPDEAARAIRTADPGLSPEQANGLAWQQGKRLLERAIAERLDFAFETTLGGRTITRLLLLASASGIEVRVWYVGLQGPELHIARVRSRVERGGHDVPEATIRKRYESSRANLVALLPELTELRVYDNSDAGDPAQGVVPQPTLVLHVRRGKRVGARDLLSTPEWAKPIVAAALRVTARRRR